MIVIIIKLHQSCPVLMTKSIIIFYWRQHFILTLRLPYLTLYREPLPLQVYTGHWQKSPHVTHFQRHPVEYQELMVAFLERVGMIEPARQRATSI